MKFRVCSSFVTILLLGSGVAVAQTAEKGRKVIDDALAALGGDKFLHMENQVATGRIYSFFHDELSGLDIAKIYTQYLPSAPSKGVAIRQREVLGKKQDYSYLFLEDQGWDVTYRGARPVPDENWQRYVRTTRNDALYILRYRLNEPGMQCDYVSSEVYLTSHVEVVDLTDSSGQTLRVYFDHNTHLPVHETFTWMDPDTRYRNDEVTEYDKYRDVGDGVMLPYSIERQRNGYKTYQLFASKIEVNQTVPSNLFELPPGVKKLHQVQ